MTIQKLLSYKTKVSYANSRSKSLKTTFPQEIKDILEANVGDEIEWCVNLLDNKIVITIERADDK